MENVYTDKMVADLTVEYNMENFNIHIEAVREDKYRIQITLVDADETEIYDEMEYCFTPGEIIGQAIGRLVELSETYAE